MPQSTDLSTSLVRPSRDGAVECEFVNFIPDLPDELDDYFDDEPSDALLWVLGSIAFATSFAFVIGSKLAGWW